MTNSANSERLAAVSTMGRRENNEDSFAADERLGLFAVADGVGGNAAGEIASATAIARCRDVIARWRADPTAMTAQIAATKAAELACAAVFEAAQRGADCRGMATTLTMMVVDGRIGHMAHVGDSRLYVLRDEALHQLSRDHTLAAELVRGGVIPREQVATHPHAHVLTRSCGAAATVTVDNLQFELRPDDVYLLASDGLNPAMKEPELVIDLLAPGRSLTEALATLLERARVLGSTDNITAVAWRCPGQVQATEGSTTAVLRAVPLFERLLTSDLHRVAQVLQRDHIPAGAVLLEPGQRTAKLIVVVDGVLRWEPDSTRRAELGPGAAIGSTTLMGPRRSPGRLVAHTQAEILTLTTKDFRRLCRRRERLGVLLLAALATELSSWIDPYGERGIPRPPSGLVVAF